jgi:hypothetical protein
VVGWLTARAPVTPAVAAAGSTCFAAVDDSCARAGAGLKADLGRCCCTCSDATSAANCNEDSRDISFSDEASSEATLGAEGEREGRFGFADAGAEEYE